MKWHLLILVTVVGALFTSLLVAFPYFSTSVTVPQVQTKKQSIERLQKVARSITVKVLVGDGWGSGILIGRQGQNYTILTNQHVLDGAKSYRVQAPDGRIYPATLSSSVRTDDDLALIQFRSFGKIYSVASLQSSSKLTANDEVFSSGFPLKVDASDSKNYEFTSGQVSIVLNRPFMGGYQIGYTNDVKRGMSGGPVLNRKGVVVGVNGMRKYPLWDDPYVFKDGSTVSENARERMSKLSWAVPIQNYLRLVRSSQPNFSQGEFQGVER